MKCFSYILTCFFIILAPLQQVYASNKMNWDGLSDEQIESCFSSDTFQNISLLYSYEDQSWELRIIFNPQHEEIELNDSRLSMVEFYYGVFSKDLIPESLKNHLKDLVKGQLGNSSGGYWGIASTMNGKLLTDYFAGAIAAHRREGSQSEEISEEETSFDQEIYDLFETQTFRKLSLNYEWGGKSYPLHFVHNPMREVLFCSGLSKPVRWPFAMTIEASSYPLDLAKHIKSLIPDELLNDPDSVIDVANWVSYFRKNSVSLYTTLQPILLLTMVENPDVDREIQAVFTSNQLTKKSLYYELNGSFYQVFLIHNPEKLKLKATLSFNTQENGKLKHTRTWNSKIGIFIDKVAPKELIDHFSGLYEISWWDNYWNLSIHNGDKISVTYHSGSWKYTYHPYTWYTFIVKAELEEPN